MVIQTSVKNCKPFWIASLKMAYQWAANSDDPSTQIGAALLRNRRSIDFAPNRAIVPEQKYPDISRCEATIHAEEGVLSSIDPWKPGNGRLGIACSLACCVRCAVRMIYHKVKILITHEDAIQEYIRRCGGDPWRIRDAHTLLSQYGVEVILIKGPLTAPTITMKGKPWDPSRDTQTVRCAPSTSSARRWAFLRDTSASLAIYRHL